MLGRGVVRTAKIGMRIVRILFQILFFSSKLGVQWSKKWTTNPIVTTNRSPPSRLD